MGKMTENLVTTGHSLTPAESCLVKSSCERIDANSAVQFCLENTSSLIRGETCDRTIFIGQICNLPTSLKSRIYESCRILEHKNATEFTAEYSRQIHEYKFEHLVVDKTTHLDLQKFYVSDSFFESKYKLATHLENVGSYQLFDYLHCTEKYEAVMLVLAYPNLCAILGNVLIYKVIVPLHVKGAFYYLVAQVVQTLTNAYSKRYLYRTFFIKFAKFKNVLKLNAFATVTLGLGSFFCIHYGITAEFFGEKSTFVQDLVKKAFATDGFNNESINMIKVFLGKTCFEIGQFISYLSQGLLKGLLSRYLEALKDIAPYIDDYIASFRRKK